MIWRPFSQYFSLIARNVPRNRATSCSRGFLSIPNPNISTIIETPPSPSDSRPGQQITVTGFIRTIRNQKLRSFVEIGDGSTIHPLQAVLDPHQAKGLATGTSVRITGNWHPAPPNKEQKYELRAHEVSVIGSSDADIYPIQKKYQTPEYLRTIPHLRLRIPFNALLARLRSECDFYLSTFFHNLEFVRAQPPIITSSDCEGASGVFAISTDMTSPSVLPKDPLSELRRNHFFREPRFLTVSSQLHLEAFVHEHKRVWSLSPTFRAEKSDTPRHLSEFWMLEAEIQTETLQDIMGLVEDMIRSLTIYLRKSKLVDEIISSKRMRQSDTDASSKFTDELIYRRWEGLVRKDWPRITYTEAIQRLKTAVDQKQVTFEYEPSWSNGFQLEHEKFIAAEFGQGSPVFVTDYPQGVKPFYMSPSKMDSDSNPNATAACFDLLLPDVCEIAGGSLREHRLEHLAQAMRKHGLIKARGVEVPTNDENENENELHVTAAGNLDWYLDLRRFGSVPHGGFGLGLDRLISYLAGVYNIKDVVPWPRWHGRCDC